MKSTTFSLTINNIDSASDVERITGMIELISVMQGEGGIVRPENIAWFMADLRAAVIPMMKEALDDEELESWRLIARNCESIAKAIDGELKPE